MNDTASDTRHAIAQGLSAREEAELALNASESQLAAIIDSVMDAIITLDPQSSVVLFNDFAAGMFGCSRADALGAPLTRFIPQGLKALQEAPPEPENPRCVAVTAQRADGSSFAVSASASRLHVNGRELITLVLRDISRRQADKAAHDALQERLRESQKMETLGTMAGSIAHDFNNIVAAILGNTRLARAQLDGADAALNCLDEIAKAGERARQMVRRILSFSRHHPTAFADQPLQPVVEETFGLLRATFPAGIDMSLDMASQPLTAHADASQISQLLMNLGTNAAQALGLQGHVRISLQPHGAHEALLEVADDGCGIDEPLMTSIFEPFFTTKESGTGLGLPAVQAIAEAHGGRVQVRSRKGVGTTFSVYLPLTLQIHAHLEELPDEDRTQPMAALPAADTDSSAQHLPLGAGRHLVYLDDYSAMVMMIEAAFDCEGFRVSGFDDAEAALAFIRANAADVDLVISDYNMPRRSGLDVAREVRRIRLDLPVIIASGCLTDELTEGEKRGDVAAVFEKTRGVDAMIALVQEVLLGHGREALAKQGAGA